jgi:NADH-ubiquinone oxidoreductase chain 5
MSVPLVLLSFGAIFIGYLTKEAIIGVGSDFFSNAIFTLPSHLNVLEAEFLPTGIK